MRRSVLALVAAVALTSCGSGSEGEDGAVRVVAPSSVSDLMVDVAAAYEADGRGQVDLVVVEDVTAVEPGSFDVAVADDEADLQALADAGEVGADSWFSFAGKGPVRLWLAKHADPADPDGALQFESFAGGVGPAAALEANGFER